MAALSRGELGSERRLVLGELGLYALAKAAKVDPELRAAIVQSEILLRAGLIDRLGSEPETLRDLHALVGLIRAEIAIAEDLKPRVRDGAIEDLTCVPLSELRKLRHVKNVLRSAELLLSEDTQELPASILWWWSRRKYLP